MTVIRRAIPHCKWIAVIGLLVHGACGEDKAAKSSSDAVVDAWKAAGLEPIELSEASDKENCLSGKVAKLHVDLCTYKDALAADSAKEAGLTKIGGFTGTALVRDHHLLVVSDVDKVDVHGKTLNTLAKIFLKPTIASNKLAFPGS